MRFYIDLITNWYQTTVYRVQASRGGSCFGGRCEAVKEAVARHKFRNLTSAPVSLRLIERALTEDTTKIPSNTSDTTFLHYLYFNHTTTYSESRYHHSLWFASEEMTFTLWVIVNKLCSKTTYVSGRPQPVQQQPQAPPPPKRPSHRLIHVFIHQHPTTCSR